MKNADAERARVNLVQALAQRPLYHSKGNLAFAVVPGGFFMRFGEWGQGLLSFGTVMGLGGLAAVAISSNFVVTGLVLAFFSFRYYLASLTESFRYLRKLNLSLRREYRSKALRASGGGVGFARHWRVNYRFQ